MVSPPPVTTAHSRCPGRVELVYIDEFNMLTEGWVNIDSGVGRDWANALDELDSVNVLTSAFELPVVRHTREHTPANTPLIPEDEHIKETRYFVSLRGILSYFSLLTFLYILGSTGASL